MAIQTMMRDNPITMMREAWQNGKCAYRWTKIDIDAMHKEAPETVPAWGCFPAKKAGYATMMPNVKLRGCAL